MLLATYRSSDVAARPRAGVQVIDLAGMSPLNMLQYVRREDAQTEWQHNMDFCPETLNKVRRRS